MAGATAVLLPHDHARALLDHNDLRFEKLYREHSSSLDGISLADNDWLSTSPDKSKLQSTKLVSEHLNNKDCANNTYLSEQLSELFGVKNFDDSKSDIGRSSAESESESSSEIHQISKAATQPLSPQSPTTKMGVRISHPQQVLQAKFVIPADRDSEDDEADDWFADRHSRSEGQRGANGGEAEVQKPAGPMRLAVTTSWLGKRRKRMAQRARVRDVAVQTEAVLGEELDYDLSDRVDKETQTLPPNPTPFQLNRTDAMAQTDCRYCSISATDEPPPPVFVPSRTYRDVGVQTVQTTSSVSTQTEEEFLQPLHPGLSAVATIPAVPASVGATPATVVALEDVTGSTVHKEPVVERGLRDTSATSTDTAAYAIVLPALPLENHALKPGRISDKPGSGLHTSYTSTANSTHRGLPSIRLNTSAESSNSTMSHAAAVLDAAFPTHLPGRDDTASSSRSLSVHSEVTAPLRVPANESPTMRQHRKDSPTVWETLGPFYLNDLLPVMKANQKFHRRRRKMVDVSVQTDLGSLSFESPEFAPHPPPCRRAELLREVNFKNVDKHVLAAPEELSLTLTSLVKTLCVEKFNDLHKVRAIFRWITENISYDWKFVERLQTAEEVLSSRAGVSKDFVVLFMGMCSQAAIRAKKLQGFVRTHEFRVGRRFDPDRDVLHYWAAVFIFGSWRLIDPTYAAGYTDSQGRYHRLLQEEYFLPDPDRIIYTHYPHSREEPDYYRWQLMDVPVTLDVFNSFPVVTPYCWRYGIRLRSPRTSPVIFTQQTELQMAASVYIRYKYKLYPADQTEEQSMNQWVFCTMKESGAVVSFTVALPTTAPHVLRIMAKPEEAIETDDTPLDHVASFLLLCTKPRRYFTPWPLHDAVWGPNPRLYQCGLDLVSEPGPVLISWGGRKHLIFEKAFNVLLLFQLYDKDANAVDTKNILKKCETEYEIHVSIVPPSFGYFKLMVFGIPKPQMQGRWRLPLLACYMIDSKANASLHEEGNGKKKKHKMKLHAQSR